MEFSEPLGGKNYESAGDDTDHADLPQSTSVGNAATTPQGNGAERR